MLHTRNWMVSRYRFRMLFAGGSVHVCLLYARRRFTLLIEVLFFSAVTHHAGMSYFIAFRGAMRGGGFIRQAAVNMRGTKQTCRWISAL